MIIVSYSYCEMLTLYRGSALVTNDRIEVIDLIVGLRTVKYDGSATPYEIQCPKRRNKNNSEHGNTRIDFDKHGHSVLMRPIRFI